MTDTRRELPIVRQLTSWYTGVMGSDLQDIADQNNLIIIEDAAQALGSRFQDKYAGTFGLAGTFSFILLSCWAVSVMVAPLSPMTMKWLANYTCCGIMGAMKMVR